MSYLTRRARIEAERQSLRHRRRRSFTIGAASLATAASASLVGVGPASASLEDPAPADSGGNASVGPASSESSSAGTYTVQQGDTLAGIAASQGVSLDTLLEANDGSTTIYPGETLQLSGSSESSASSSTEASSGTAESTATAESASSTQTASADAGDSEMAVQTASATSAAPSSGGMGAAAQQAISIANSGAGYSLGSEGPSAYDCSALTQTAMADAGVDLPRTSGAQFSGASQHVSLDNLQVGDLVFWSSNGSASGIYHVAMYVGDGQIAQARNPSAGISVDSLDHYMEYNAPMGTAARY